MLTLSQLQSLTQTQLILHIKKLQTIEGLVEELKQLRLNTIKYEYSIVLLSNPDGPDWGFFMGRNDRLLDALFAVMDSVAKSSGLELRTILTDFLSRLPKEE